MAINFLGCFSCKCPTIYVEELLGFTLNERINYRDTYGNITFITALREDSNIGMLFIQHRRTAKGYSTIRLMLRLPLLESGSLQD